MTVMASGLAAIYRNKDIIVRSRHKGAIVPWKQVVHACEICSVERK